MRFAVAMVMGFDCGLLAAALGRAGWASGVIYLIFPNLVSLLFLICADKSDMVHRT